MLCMGELQCYPFVGVYLYLICPDVGHSGEGMYRLCLRCMLHTSTRYRTKCQLYCTHRVDVEVGNGQVLGMVALADNSLHVLTCMRVWPYKCLHAKPAG